ncbi:MAG: Ribosomal RNA large subunit methyltransferase I [Alphaproteobacteria bacterium ADurb.BinA280]|jgi:23S rRNA (cytosine1962-C5)-methyltransferase|nr:MAG: Ribosomal RNA large subunit methyltransferase I [Alphaproteobacteria bacterium ADurb.BinA280]
MSGPEYPALYLKRGEDKRLRAGHLWVFSNEVDTAKSPLPEFPVGGPVWILDASGKPLGTGYANPSTLICARLVDRGGKPLDRSLITHRLNVALSLRERLRHEPFYRLVFGEADGLPGLVIDRFDDIVVAQLNTAGMQAVKDEVQAAIEKVLKPSALVWKNDSSARTLEGLPEQVDVVFGTVPERVRVKEGGLDFELDVLQGQKTGWFYDQHDNRDRLQPWVKGAKVLDLFSYVGAWGIRAAGFGAEDVTCVDASSSAVAQIEANARLNGFAGRVHAVRADAFEFLRDARAEKRHWDVVVLDPPAFIKRRKDFKEGALAYRRINEMAMQVLARDGILVSASCSHHMGRPALLEAIQTGARHLDRQVQVLCQLQQSADHPVHAAIPETDYLKGYIGRVLPA